MVFRKHKGGREKEREVSGGQRECGRISRNIGVEKYALVKECMTETQSYASHSDRLYIIKIYF